MAISGMATWPESLHGGHGRCISNTGVEEHQNLMSKTNHTCANLTRRAVYGLSELNMESECVSSTKIMQIYASASSLGLDMKAQLSAGG